MPARRAARVQSAHEAATGRLRGSETVSFGEVAGVAHRRDRQIIAVQHSSHIVGSVAEHDQP